jgi:A/G-specific adenine glycosylase
MLQQTQVATVIPYFERFMVRFPTVFDLAKSDEQDVLKAWEGLGYYTRARNLHKAAQIVATEYHGEVPDSFASLQLLPGLGPYASAAIASIAFAEPVPSVDGNFLRVFARFWGIEESISNTKVQKDVFLRLQSVISLVDPSAFNQGVMELGATLCKPRSPLCQQCPISQDCWALLHNKVQDLPVKTKLGKVPHIEVGAAIVWHNNKILITRRPEGKMLAGLWEFPGGKQESNESIETTIKRELLEETSLEIKLISELGVYKHTYSHFTLRLHAWQAHAENVDQLHTDVPYKWVGVDELKKFPFPEVDRKIIRDIQLLDSKSII